MAGRPDEAGLRADDDGDLEAATTALKAEAVRSGSRAQPLVMAPGILVVDRTQLPLGHGDSSATNQDPERLTGAVEQLDEGWYAGPLEGHGRRSIDQRLVSRRRTGGRTCPVLRQCRGLYVVGIGTMASFVFMVTGAWLLIVGVRREEAAEATA
jgi:hypothetical protein